MAFLAGFGKRKELRYGTAFPSANLTDFPKLFTIAGDSDIAAELAGGGGIAVTAADGETPVPFGLYPSSDPTSGDLILRAKFDVLTAATTGDVIGYLYYDSTASTTEDKAGVVSNGYALFMPLEEDPSGVAPQIRDWVTDTLLGTSNGGMTSTDLVAGQVGKGLDFDGSDDFVSVVDGGATNFTRTTPFTVDFNGILNTTTDNRWLIARMASTTGPGWGLRRFGATDLALMLRSGASTLTEGSVACDNTRHHWSWGWDGNSSGDVSGISCYKDGTSEIVVNRNNLLGTNTMTGGSIPVTLGARLSSGSNHAASALDEVKISSVLRSAAWRTYSYTDDFANADTFSLGPEETDGGGPATFDPAWASQCNVVIGGQVW